jgi:HEAT repeat protein
LLGKGNQTVIEAFLHALKDEDSDIRRKAVDSLGRLGKADKNVMDALIQALKDESSSVRVQAADSLVRLGKVDKNVMDALIQALKDESSSVRRNAAASLGNLWEKKSGTELMELLKHPLSGYRTAAAYALVKKKSISPETRDEIIRLKDTDNRSWVRLGAWKAYELLQEKKEKEQKKALGE